MMRMYAMARVASAWVSVRGSPARSASSPHPSGMRTRSSSAREGRASSTRAIAASTAGIPRYLADVPVGLIAERKGAPFRLCRQGRAGDATSIRTVLPIILIIAPAKRRVFKSGLPNHSENGYLSRQIGSHPANPDSTRTNAPARRPLRGSQFVPWLASIRASPGREKMRVCIRRPQLSAGKFRAREDAMPDNRSRTAKASLVPVGLILFAAFVLSGCVQSKKPLLTGSKPLLGMQFQLNLYQDFIEGKALSATTSVFRWNDTHYSLVSGDSSGVEYVVIQPFDSDNLLIEATYENDNVYLLGRKLAKGTYRILPIDQNDVDEATRARTCVTRNPVICMIQTRRQLDTLVRAAAAKKGGYIMVGVISAAARSGERAKIPIAAGAV